MRKWIVGRLGVVDLPNAGLLAVFWFAVGAFTAGVPTAGAQDVVVPADAEVDGLALPAPLWSHRVRGERDVAYGDHPEQRLDYYVQGQWLGEPVYFADDAPPRPTVIFFHGGGWMQRYPSTEPWTGPFLTAGWNVVSPIYRIGAGTAPAAVDDALCAVKWVYDNADALNFDRNRIVLAGASAGGHLALTAAILNQSGDHTCALGEDMSVAAVVNWYGVADIGDQLADPNSSGFAQAWIGDKAKIDAIVTAYSPTRIATSAMPAVLSLHGTDDSVVAFSQSADLHARLNELGVPNRLVALEVGNHGGFSDAQHHVMVAQIFQFLDTALDTALTD